MKSITYFFGGIVLLLFIPIFCQGQTYIMPAGTTVTCSGNFYDPGGSASDYPDVAPATYVSTFTAESGDQIYMGFAQIPPAFTKNLMLETGDVLRIYDGATTSDPLIGEYTAASTAVPTLRATGSSLTFEFITDGDGLSAYGWNASFRCITMPDGSHTLSNSATPISIACNTRNDFYDPGGSMAPYPSTGSTYAATYTTATGKPMLVNIKDFSTNFRDTLFIYDGNSDSAPLIGTYQGFQTASSFTTSTDAITFKFKENGDGITNVGWFITATCIREEAITCGAPVLDHDPAGPTKNYKASFAGERFLTTYTAPAGQHLEATITNFSTNWAFNGNLLIYDGPNTSSPLIGTFSGTGFNTYQVSSSGNTLTFYINTLTATFLNYNFDVTFNCTSDQQGSTYTIGGSTSPVEIPCGVTSKVIDLGGNTYAPEHATVASPYIQTYTVPAGQYIKLEFTELNLQDNGDRLNIYDGASTADPLIAMYTSINNPSNRNPKPAIAVTSSSNSITVELKTDQDNSLYQGFEAEIICLSDREGSNFSLGNSTGPVSIMCGTSSTFEDFFGTMPYVDNVVQEYTTTYIEANGDPVYFAFMDFSVASGDTLYAYNGASTSDPLIGKYSGSLTPFSIGVTGPVTFRFVTNGADNPNMRGWYATINCNDPLPVEWLRFMAVAGQDKVKLEWSTASERSNNYFVVEKSMNGVGFFSLDTIRGAGDFTGPLSYDYIDYEPYQLISYYRIKQVDFDGRSSYSLIQSVGMNDLSINIYPQPAIDHVSIAISDSENHEVKIQLLDKVGKMLFEKVGYVNENNVMQIDMSGYATGLYFLMLTEGDYSVTKKLFKK